MKNTQYQLIYTIIHSTVNYKFTFSQKIVKLQTYSHKNASASSMKRSIPFWDFLDQSKISWILVTASDPKGTTSPPVIIA